MNYIQVFGLGLVAATATFFINFTLATLLAPLTGAPKDYAPFTVLPLLAGSLGGSIGATLVYIALHRFVENPDRVFLITAIVILVLSFGLPLRLSFTQSPRFLGVTLPAQLLLASFHTIIASSVVIMMTKLRYEISRQLDGASLMP